MSETARDRTDYEIINGQAYMMARPSMDHVSIALSIGAIFKNYLKGKTCKVYIEPDLFLDDKNNFIPDVVILCDSSKKKYKGIYGAPDLVVEILSPSTDKRDLGEKKDLYGKYGVKEYWTVDPKAKKITVHYLSNNSLYINNVYYYLTQQEIKDMPDDDQKVIVSTFNVSIFDDLTIKLEDVFEDIE